MATLLKPDSIGFFDPFNVLGSNIAPRQLSSIVSSAAECEKFVYCDNGNQVFLNGTYTNESCHVACEKLGGNCCTSSDSCNGFTGSVCADDNQTSCAGQTACFDAIIPIVVDSCDGGFQACEKAKIGSVVNSCKADQSCWLAGNGGSIKEYLVYKNM